MTVRPGAVIIAALIVTRHILGEKGHRFILAIAFVLTALFALEFTKESRRELQMVDAKRGAWGHSSCLVLACGS